MERQPRVRSVDQLQTRVTEIYEGLPQRVKDYIKRDTELKNPKLPPDKRELYIAQREQLYFQIQETPDLIEPFTMFAQSVAELAYEKQQQGLE